MVMVSPIFALTNSASLSVIIAPSSDNVNGSSVLISLNFIVLSIS